jgi:hypothetical protein
MKPIIVAPICVVWSICLYCRLFIFFHDRNSQTLSCLWNISVLFKSDGKFKDINLLLQIAYCSMTLSNYDLFRVRFI